MCISRVNQHFVVLNLFIPINKNSIHGGIYDYESFIEFKFDVKHDNTAKSTTY